MQRIFLLYGYECFENKKIDEKQRKNKGMASAISLLVKIWKISRIPDGVSYGNMGCLFFGRCIKI